MSKRKPPQDPPEEDQLDWVGEPPPVNSTAGKKFVENVRLNDSQRRVFHVVKAAGLHGATCGEVALELDVQMHVVSPRFGELRAKGLLMVVPGDRKDQQIWRAVYL